MSVSIETNAFYVRTARAATGVAAGLLLLLTVFGSPVANGFKDAATTGLAALPGEARDTCKERSTPEAYRCSQEAARTAIDSPADSICRTRYKGAPPDFAAPPAYIVDVALPSIYCGNVNQWVFIYPTRAGVQLYRLDPGKRESYRIIFSDAARGTTTPWALRRARSGGVIYFVNMEPARTRTFDYTVSARRFDVCLELAALPRVKIVSSEGIDACQQPAQTPTTVRPKPGRHG